MGGPGSGRKKGDGRNNGGRRIPRDKNVVVQAQSTDAGDPTSTHAAIVFGKLLLGLEPIDFTDAKQAEERFHLFLELCDEHNLRPMVTGLAMAYGINRNQLQGIASGRKELQNYKGITPECRSIIRKSYEFLEYFLELKLETEKGNPVKWFFLAKNHFGYRDQSEQITRVIDETPRLADPQALAEKYLADSGAIEVEAEIVDSPRLPDSHE